MTERDEQMLTVADVAHLLQVAAKTVRRMVAAGEFPAPLRVSGSDRWTLGDVRAWQLERKILARRGSATVDNAGQSGTSAPEGGKGTSGAKDRR